MTHPSRVLNLDMKAYIYIERDAIFSDINFIKTLWVKSNIVTGPQEMQEDGSLT